MMDSTRDGDTTQTKKRAHTDCLIHCSDDASYSLVTLKGHDSWKTLLRAAEIRQHAPVLDLANNLDEGEVPQIQYHRKCRSIFTMKKLLDSILSKGTTSSSESAEGTSRRSSRGAPSTSRVHDKVCIFCQKSSKYLKGAKTREPLVQCLEMRADETVRKAAIDKDDDRILALLSRDLVAAEGHYRRSCYRVYTKVESSAGPYKKRTQGDEEMEYEEAERLAYNDLFLFVRNEFLPSCDILPLTYFTSRLERSMNSLGIIEIKLATKKHVRRKLEYELAGALHFVSNEKEKVLVYPDGMVMDDLVKAAYTLKRDLLEARSVNFKQGTLTRAVIQLRDDIKKQEISQTWPPDTEQTVIPRAIIEFLYTLLTGDAACPNPSERTKRLATSFGSDIVFAVSGGSTKPPKHILLPFAVKSLTGNTELIRTLNRLGHCVSYSQVEETDTALCVQKMERTACGNLLPQDVHPGVFTTLAWDNIDRLEETLSGEGTSHRVNGIAVQAKVAGPMPQGTLPEVNKKSKKRSISPAPLMLPAYNAGKRAGPPKTETLDVNSTREARSAQVKNHIWLLTRIADPTSQTVSSWTGFNILTRNDVIVAQDTVTYLPTINAPATNMSTVNEVLEQTLRITQVLQLNEIVCVFDQALYAKAAEIVWKQEKFKKIIIRMGAFHTICNLLSIIGKRFQDARLRDLCVESGVIADGSIAGVMEGRRYNRGVRLHKLVYEALMRLAWKGLLPWLQNNHIHDSHHLDETLQRIVDFRSNVCQASLLNLLEDNSCRRIFELFQSYMNSLREHSFSAFWISYVDMVEIMLGLIRSSREGDWMLHLAAIRQMIPWCFSYDKLNYARFLTYYYATMSRLPIEHPEVHKHFMQGRFQSRLVVKTPSGGSLLIRQLRRPSTRTHRHLEALPDIRVPEHLPEAAEGYGPYRET